MVFFSNLELRDFCRRCPARGPYINAIHHCPALAPRSHSAIGKFASFSREGGEGSRYVRLYAE